MQSDAARMELPLQRLALIPAADAGAALRQPDAGGRQSGSDVKALQRYLDRAGFDTTADGQYGPATARSERSFEADAHRRPDGRATRNEQRPRGSAPSRSRRRHRAVAASDATETPTTTAGDAYVDDDGPGRRARVRADRGAGDHRRGQQDRQQAVQVRRRPRALARRGLRLLGLGVLRAARRGPARLAARLRGFMSWGERGRGTWVTIYANAGPRVHGRGGPALRHQRPQGLRLALERNDAVVARLPRPASGGTLMALWRCWH